MKRLPGYFSGTQPRAIGTTARFLLLSLTLSGCATLAPRAPCPVDLSLLRDLTLPTAPRAAPINGDFLSFAQDVKDSMDLDAERKAELRKQLERCQQ